MELCSSIIELFSLQLLNRFWKPLDWFISYLFSLKALKLLLWLFLDRKILLWMILQAILKTLQIILTWT